MLFKYHKYKHLSIYVQCEAWHINVCWTKPTTNVWVASHSYINGESILTAVVILTLCDL